VSAADDAKHAADMDEAMRRLDAFLAANEPELPKLALAAVLVQRGMELSMECGIPRKPFVASIDEMWKRTHKAAAAARGKVQA
jgi:hypothetical protein